MKNKIAELEHLKSDRFLLWVVIFTLPLLCSNMYYVYNKLSVLPEPWRNRVSLGVALVLAGFIIIYTVRKNYRMAKYFAYFEALISAYYYIVTIGWDWDLLPAFGFTAILPAALFHSAKEIKQDDVSDMVSISDMQDALDSRDAEIGTLKEENLLLRETNKAVAATLERSEMEVDGLREKLESLIQKKTLEEVQAIKKPEEVEEIKQPEVVLDNFQAEEPEQTSSAFLAIHHKAENEETPDPIHDPIIREKKKIKGEPDAGPDFWERQKE